MQKSPPSSSNQMIPLCVIMVSLISLISAASFRFILSMLQSFLGIISCTRVSSSPTFLAAAEAESESDGHRNLAVWGVETLIENEGSAGIECLFDEEEPSLMEVKAAFDVFDENTDGFIDADELRTVLVCLGFNAEEDECERMMKGFDKNFDGRIDFNEFVKVLEKSFGY